LAETAVVGSLICDRRNRWDAVVLSFDKLGAREGALGEGSGRSRGEDGLRICNGGEDGRREEAAGHAMQRSDAKHLEHLLKVCGGM
jgi:hypothetical protein